MATGHILPGYGTPVSRLRRVRSAGCYPLDSSTLLELKNAARLTQREFDQIRENARDIWSRDTRQPTTYDTFFGDGTVREITLSRPTSSHRHNNPHPPQVFLTNRLHYIEGYQNPDTRLKKGVYRIDASLDPSMQQLRREPRRKYVARPDASLTNQYKDSFEDGMAGRPKTAYPSLNRWMKLAGVEEADATAEAMRYTTPTKQPEEFRCLSRHMTHRTNNNDMTGRSYHEGRHQLRRGEFSMHPEWPPTIPHHNIE